MRATEFVESYFDAWNHRDPKGIADHLCADGTYLDIPEHSLRTPEELIVSLKNFFANDRHRYELIGEILKGKDTIAFQYRMYPYGNDCNQPKQATYHGAEFMTLHGNEAYEITDYYDVPINTKVHKYAKSGLTSSQLHKHKQRLDQVMRSQKVYLKPELTLPKLAEDVGCSVNHLSQVINSGFGTSFFDYLNGYRIEHAMDLLENLNSQSTAILNIAFTVGFNSNSAFYAAFNKRVGITPAQYRLRHQNKRA